MFGDTLLAAAAATQSYYLGIGRIYLFSFVILLFVGGLNIALSITLDSYYVIKHKLKLFRFEDEMEEEQPSDSALASKEFREAGPEDSSPGPLPSTNRVFRHPARTQGGAVLSPEDYSRAMEGLFALLECLPDDGDDVSSSKAISVEDIAEVNSMMTTN
jgi:hypothetical protein